jgi:prepilin-type N-terminal cleavage/methylation domain-containing protein
MESERNHSVKPFFEGRSRERGFTLLELVVAISILTIGILGVASMQVSAIRGNHFASDVTEASTWASDEIEKLIRLSWDDAGLQDTDGDGVNGLDDIGANSDQALVTQGKYTIQCNFADDVVIADTKTVHVIVTWTNHGAQRRITLRRVIPRIT